MQRILAALLLLCIASAAHAQQAPYVYPLTIGTASVQILAVNQLRKKLIFHNPNDAVKVAVCPIGPSRSGSPTTNVIAAINGAGCITILPYDRVEISGGSGPQLGMQSAWVGIAASSSSALTIIEFE